MPNNALTDPAAIAELVAKSATNGPAQLWLTQLMAINTPSAGKLSLGGWLLAIAGIVTAFVLAYGVFFQRTLLGELAAPGNARGLMTFLFTFATIAVVIITIIATFWVRLEEVVQRATIAKEILTILIGIMGTILGFYFGQAQPAATPAEPPEASSAPSTPSAPTTPGG